MKYRIARFRVRASEVAAQLINNDKVDIMVASSTSDTVNPVSDQCEVNGVPCTCQVGLNLTIVGSKELPK